MFASYVERSREFVRIMVAERQARRERKAGGKMEREGIEFLQTHPLTKAKNARKKA